FPYTTLFRSLHQRRREEVDAVLADPSRRAGRVVLLLEDQPLQDGAAAPAVLLRPRHDPEARLAERPLPLPVRREALLGLQRRQRLRRDVRAQPRPHLGAELLVRRPELKIHPTAPPYGDCRYGNRRPGPRGRAVPPPGTSRGQGRRKTPAPPAAARPAPPDGVSRGCGPRRRTRPPRAAPRTGTARAATATPTRRPAPAAPSRRRTRRSARGSAGCRRRRPPRRSGRSRGRGRSRPGRPRRPGPARRARSCRR